MSSQTFPALSVKDLEGASYSIPHDLPGGPHVIVMAFQQWHQAIVDEWKPHLERIASANPGMEVWEVPSISKAYRLFRAGIDGGMRAGIPDKTTREHTLTAYTDLGDLARNLGLPSLETVYVFLVDCGGQILWRGAGEPTPAALSELEAALPDTC